MHIWFKRRPKVETVVTLELTVEEAQALYWSIVPGNTHMRRWMREPVADALSETAQDIEADMFDLLINIGADPGALTEDYPVAA